MELSAKPREILGKKVRFLRRQGLTPVNLFGHNVEPVVLQCDTAQLKHVLVRTGKTKLISLMIDKAKKPRNVMVREVQREPQTGELLHVDFYQVSMEEKVRVELPIVTIGEAPALKTKENFSGKQSKIFKKKWINYIYNFIVYLMFSHSYPSCQLFTQYILYSFELYQICTSHYFKNSLNIIIFRPWYISFDISFGIHPLFTQFFPNNIFF